MPEIEDARPLRPPSSGTSEMLQADSAWACTARRAMRVPSVLDFSSKNPDMLYQFKSQATADVVMLEPNARQLLDVILEISLGSFYFSEF
ncbi:DUF1840 family protein [Staphylococcus warneri]|uniref:DUF1840 family protein n=1 Tax=Staphylococcus warneri TaxID=1292 RepID=UPI002FD87FB4